jgi:hypothetical protein
VPHLEHGFRAVAGGGQQPAGRGEDDARLVGVPARRAAGEKDDFPAPLPWSRRAKRWNPEAVRAWKRRQELRARSMGAPELRSIAGGKA